MSKIYKLPKKYKLPEGVIPKVEIQEPTITFHPDDSSLDDVDKISLLANQAEKEAKKTIISAIAEQCIKVGIDPDILHKQLAELKHQTLIIENFQDMVSKGALHFQPAELGREVWVLDNGKIFRATVYRYEQCLSPYHKNQLSYVDLHIGEVDTIVRRYCHEFGKCIFFTDKEARDARNASIEAQTAE